MNATALNPIDVSGDAAGVGDRGDYQFLEFPISADAGIETIKVNVASGNLFIRTRLMELAGPGVGASAYRVFNSMDRWTQASGWATDFDRTGLWMNGEKVSFFDGTGAHWDFSPSAGGWVAPAGANASLVENADGSWTLSYNRSGEKIQFNRWGWMTARQDRNGVGSSYQWDDFGMLISITDAAGKKISMTRNSSNFLTGVSAAGRSTTQTYSAQGGWLTAADYGAGRSVQYTTSSGRVTEVALGDKKVAFTFDTSGRVTQVSVSKAGESARVTKFAYGAGTTVVTDARGGQTTYTTNPEGLVTSVKDQLGRSRSIEYSANNDVTEMINAMSYSTTTTYDTLNNATQITLPTGATTKAAYGTDVSCGNSASGAGQYQANCVTDAQGNRTTFTYDPATKNVLSSKDVSSNAQFTYTYQGIGGASCGGFRGQICSSTDPNGNKTAYGYTGGNLTSITPPSPLGQTTMGYDSVGRLTWVRDGRGTTTMYEYDAADRLTKIAYANGQLVINTYNPDGTLKTESDGAAWLSYAYDALGNKTRQDMGAPSGSGIGGSIVMGYDPTGNLISYNDGTGSVTYSYDAAGQLSELREKGNSCQLGSEGKYPAANSGCTRFAYDAAGNRITVIYPGAARVDRTFDDSGRLLKDWVRDSSGVTRLLKTFDYGNPTRSTPEKDRSVLIAATSSVEEGVPAGAVTSYGYDSRNRITSVVEKTSAGAVNASWAYAYDKSGNRTQATASGNLGQARSGAVTFTYNAANQITGATNSGTWAYDKAGNEIRNGFTNQTSVYGDRGQVTQIGGDTAAYFADGNERVWRYGGTNYQLSPLGFTRFSEGGVSVRVVRTPSGQPIATHRSAGQYLVTNQQGSVVGRFTASGQWVGGATYDPYGQVRFTSGTAYTNLAFLSQPQVGGAMYKLGARYYDASTGRFTQMDPTGQEANPYLYAGGNPCNNVDPTGTMPSAVYCMLGSSLAGGVFSGTWGTIAWAVGSRSLLWTVAAPTGLGVLLAIGLGVYCLGAEQ